MNKVDPTGHPVNGEDASALRNHEALAPAIERFLGLQSVAARALLHRKLKACESPIEVAFALSVLAARDRQGHPFELTPNVREEGLLAEGYGGELYTQFKVRLGGKIVRLDFALITRKDRLAIELDGRAAHASEGARAADAGRDRLLTAAGWKPVRVTGAEVWRDPDRCCAQTLAILGVEMIHGAGGALPPLAKTKPGAPRMAPEETRRALDTLHAALDATSSAPAAIPVRPAHLRARK